MSNDITSVILAGGKGTRLRPLTVYTPKPIVPVANRPFMAFQLDMLAKAGVRDVTLSLNYQPNKIEDVMGDGIDHGVRLSFITEPSPLGTGGAFRYAAHDDGATHIVLNGDIMTDLDLSAVLNAHKKAEAAATLVLVRVDDPSRYGLVETADDGSILRFLEKPKPEEVGELGINTINAGIYILEKEILGLIPKGENSSFEYNVFPAILEKGLRFNAYIPENTYWRDIGTTDSYLQAHHDLLNGNINGFERPKQDTADIATAAEIDNLSLIGEGAVIKPHARVVNSVIGPGVLIEEKAVVENSVVWAHSRISTAAEVNDAIICRSCHIGRNASVNAGTVLGDKAMIPDYSKL
ncbi:MAG: NDP-sugar synthase [Acidobacteria bacterium]|nr:NDP-sugar synthase [Acidobacteriota bacterium]